MRILPLLLGLVLLAACDKQAGRVDTPRLRRPTGTR